MKLTWTGFICNKVRVRDIFIMYDTSINQIKCICQEHNHFVNEGSLESVNEKLLKGMRDY